MLCWMSVVAVRKMLQDRAYLLLFVWFSESQIHDGGGTDYMFYSFTIFYFFLYTPPLLDRKDVVGVASLTLRVGSRLEGTFQLKFGKSGCLTLSFKWNAFEIERMVYSAT